MKIVAPEAALGAHLVWHRGRGVRVPDDECVHLWALLGVGECLREARHVDHPRGR